MKKNILIALIILTSLFSCKENQDDLICKKWKSISSFNPKQERELAYVKKNIDSMSSIMSAFEKISKEEAKKSILGTIDSLLQDQKINAENIFYDFKSNHIAYVISPMGQDSAMWKIEDNKIYFDEQALNKRGTTMMHQILKLTKDTLEFLVIDFDDSNFVKMVPAE